MSLEKTVEKGVKGWFVINSTRENIDFVVEQAKMSTPNFILHVQEDFGDYDFRDRLNSIKHPILIFVGREDKTTPPEESEIIKNGIKDSELHIISNCGHLVMVEQSGVFNQITLEFLRKHLKSTDGTTLSSN